MYKAEGPPEANRLIDFFLSEPGSDPSDFLQGVAERNFLFTIRIVSSSG